MSVFSRARYARLFTMFLFEFIYLQCVCSEEIIMHYDSVRICKGDSFPLQSYLANQVEVPVDCQLVGWEDMTADYVCPTKDTVCYLLYRSVYDLKEKRKPFFIKVRDRPKVSILSEKQRVCFGSGVDEVLCDVENCDYVYWQEVETGKEYASLRDVKVEEYGAGTVRLFLIGSNEHCAEVVYDEYVMDVVDPSRFRLSLDMPPDEYSICGDSLLLCDYVKPSLAKLHYGDELVERYYEEDLKIALIWDSLDAYTNCDSMVKESYTNVYNVSISKEEPVCHSLVTLTEEHALRLFCTGKSQPSYSVSYSCAFGKGVIYLGAELPIVNVQFRSLKNGEGVLPEYKPTEEYNLDTYKFPYKGCANLCWDDGESERFYEILMECKNEQGEMVYVRDSLEVSACTKKAPVVQTECLPKSNESLLYIASMDSIVSSLLYSTEAVAWNETSKKSDKQKEYQYSKTYVFKWEDCEFDSLWLNVELSYMGCEKDTIATKTDVKMERCGRDSRLYYGAYQSPGSILLQREECMKHQCSNVPSEDPAVVKVSQNCYGDTIYLKFKGVGLTKGDNYELRLDTRDTSWVIFPSEYKEIEKGVYSFSNWETMNPTIAVVPQRGTEIEGSLSGVKFSFSVDLAHRVVEKEYYVCQGNAFDLNKVVSSEEEGLKWNVVQTKVSPLKDSEYYLYGFTKNGCLVDEKVVLRVGYPVWIQSAGKEFCEYSLVPKEDLFHTNAQKIVWYENGVEMDNNPYFYLEPQNSYEVDLYSVCDSIRHSLTIKARDCEEKRNPEVEKKERTIDIPLFFSPNGDGVDDYWTIEGLEEGGVEWKCVICDRYGKVLSYYENTKVHWNGTYEGRPLPTTDYWYCLEVDGESKVGHFTLLRP